MGHYYDVDDLNAGQSICDQVHALVWQGDTGDAMESPTQALERIVLENPFGEVEAERLYFAPLIVPHLTEQLEKSEVLEDQM